MLQVLHPVFCGGPDLVKDLFSKLRESVGVRHPIPTPRSGSVGVSHPRASGLLLKWVQDLVSKASFLQLLTALLTSGLRQLPPVFFILGRLAWQYLGSMVIPQGSLQFLP